MTVEKPKPKQLLQPITTGAGSAMNQSQFIAITCNSREAREELRLHGEIGFGFDFHWLKNWRESFKPITKRSNRNHVITFDSHLKTALSSNSFNVRTTRTKGKKLTKALPCTWAEIGKSEPRKEPIRSLNSLPCPLGKKELLIERKRVLTL